METYLKTHGAVKEIHTQTARDSRERWENVARAYPMTTVVTTNHDSIEEATKCI